MRPRSPEPSLNNPIFSAIFPAPNAARFASRRRAVTDMGVKMDPQVPTNINHPELVRARAMAQWLGRPHIAQRRLLDLFIAALVADFEAGGAEAIERLRLLDPVNYLRLVAVIVPRQLSDVTARNGEYDDEIADALDRVRDIADAYYAGVGKGEQGRGTPEETPALPALPEADGVP